MSPKWIIVLGYALNSDCSMHSALQLRLDTALSIYNEGDTFLVSGQSPPKAATSQRCEATTEARAMESYLISMGIPPSKILKEEKSHTTLGNAWYIYWDFLRFQSPKEITIVSNHFHEMLVRYVFDKILGKSYSYKFYAASDPSLDDVEILQRKQHIERIVKECYPKLFGSVKDGDVEALASIIGSSANEPFKKCVREVMNMESTAEILLI